MGNEIFYVRAVWNWEKQKVDELFIPAADIVEAVTIVNAYYGNDLVSVKLYPFDSSVVNVAYIEQWLEEARRI